MRSAAEDFRKCGKDIKLNVIDTHALIALQGTSFVVRVRSS